MNPSLLHPYQFFSSYSATTALYPPPLTLHSYLLYPIRLIIKKRELLDNMKKSAVWHPNTQMSEWSHFDKITKAKGVWLIDSNGHKMIDGVASMWCNVWGHSNKEMINAIKKQIGYTQHTPMFNLTHEPAEQLGKKLIGMSPAMYKVFFSDNGSSAMEIAIKIALQYWKNINEPRKNKIAGLANGYHGDTFGSMSIGYIPQFFKKFKTQLFPTIQFPTPNQYHMPTKFRDIEHYQQHILDKIEKTFLMQSSEIAAFVMESGAQLAGGVTIFPNGFQQKIQKLCKKHNVLFILDEIATGFGRLGAMTQYTQQKSMPDIVAYGKMLTGGYITLAATLTTKAIYNTFLGKFEDYVHLFHGHTYTANPIASAAALKNLELYKKNGLIRQIQKTSKIFDEYKTIISQMPTVGDIRHKGMVMGIELVSDKKKKTSVQYQKSINKIFFEHGKKNGIYLRTLGNIVMLVPPLAISQNELHMLITRTIKTIRDVEQKVSIT